MSNEEKKFVQSNMLIEQKQVFSIYEFRIFYQVLRHLYVKECDTKKKLMEQREDWEKEEYGSKLSEFERESIIKELRSDENRIVVIEIPEFNKEWDLKGKGVYVEVIKVLKDIKEKTSSFEIVSGDVGERDTRLPAMFEDASYKEGENAFQIVVTRAIMPYIVALDSEFTVMALSEISKLTTSTAMRLYELLLQYRKLGTREFLISDFCEKMHLSEKYIGRRDNLAKRVIEPALKNIENTNIEATYVYKGRGKKTKIIFTINQQKKEKAPNTVVPEEVDKENIGEFTEFIYSKLEGKKVTNKEAYINKIIESDKEKILGEFSEYQKQKNAKARKKDNELLEVYYKKLRETAERDAAKRKQQVFEKSSQIREVTAELEKLLPNMAAAFIQNRVNVDGKVYDKESLSKKIEELSQKYDKILEEMGYTKDYLGIKYRCEECGDTGYRLSDGAHCSCRKERLTEARCED